MLKIISSLPGRLRFRATQLQSWQQAKTQIENMSGVVQLVANVQTKSLLVFYRADDAKTHQALQKLGHPSLSAPPALVPPKTARPRPSFRARQRYRARINQILLASLIASLVAIFFNKNKKWHALTGIGFTAVLALHLWEHRRILKKQLSGEI